MSPRLGLTQDSHPPKTLSHRTHSFISMDIHIILNPDAAGTPSSKSNAQSKKKQTSKAKLTRGRGSGTPTSARSSPGSAAVSQRRSSQRGTPKSATPSGSAEKSYDVYATSTSPPIRQRSSSARQQSRSSPLVRQSRPRKRALEVGLGFEYDASTSAPKQKGRERSAVSTRSVESSESGHSSATAGDESNASASSRARLLLSRAKEHVQLEAIALGRSRSMMDVVMDLKGETEDGEGALVMVVDQDRKASYPDASSYLQNDYALTNNEQLATYWATQAAIWVPHFNSSPSSSNLNPHRKKLAFPTSMERSTVGWDY
ncbi:hypothetical protein R3P38DRAFT_683665 [Favolaschia claudopus]|uniref:Uncharacterized protein n=1 Tax=Favolaschia claudopus TaxID=2862362 RepID=A0AAW0EDN4_9AGAR